MDLLEQLLGDTVAPLNESERQQLDHVLAMPVVKKALVKVISAHRDKSATALTSDSGDTLRERAATQFYFQSGAESALKVLLSLAKGPSESPKMPKPNYGQKEFQRGAERNPLDD